MLFCSQGTTFLPGLSSFGRILLGVVVVGGEAAPKGRCTCPSSLLRGLPGLLLQTPCHSVFRTGLPPSLPLATQAGPLCLWPLCLLGPCLTLAPGAHTPALLPHLCLVLTQSFLFQRDLPLALFKITARVPLITPSAHFQVYLSSLNLH